MKKLSFEYVKEQIEAIPGYKLLSEKYINCSTKMKIQCPNGHIMNKNYDCFKQGDRCAICSGKVKYRTDQIIEYFQKYNYKVLSNYKNCMSKLKLKCPENHIIFMRFNDFQQGHRCKECFLENNIGENHPRWNPDIKKNTNIIRIQKNKKWIIQNMKHDPNYSNYINGVDDFHLDHTLPVSAFSKIVHEQDLDIIRIKKIANHKRNLKLITKTENLKKNAKYNREELINYVNKYY